MRSPAKVTREPVNAKRSGAVRRAPLPFQSATAKDPLNNMEAAPTDLEAQQKEILARLTSAYRDQEKAQRAQYKEANSTAYYRVVVFETVAQAEAFAVAVGQPEDMQMMDGRAVAHALGIELPEATWKPKKANPSAKFAERALPLKK